MTSMLRPAINGRRSWIFASGCARRKRRCELGRVDHVDAFEKRRASPEAPKTESRIVEGTGLVRSSRYELCKALIAPWFECFWPGFRSGETSNTEAGSSER